MGLFFLLTAVPVYQIKESYEKCSIYCPAAQSDIQIFVLANQQS